MRGVICKQECQTYILKCNLNQGVGMCTRQSYFLFLWDFLRKFNNQNVKWICYISRGIIYVDGT